MEKKLTINPFKNTITVKGFDFIEDCEMPLYDFKNLCFKNNWEGTLHKVINAEAQIIPLFEEAINLYIEKRKANQSLNQTNPLEEK